MTGPIEPTPKPATPPEGAADEPDEPTPRRRLDRPPGERLSGTGRPGGEPDHATVGAASTGSVGRALAMGTLGAAIGVAVYLVLAIVFSFSAGLLVVAIFTGRFVGLFVRAGAGASLSSAGRVVASVAIFLVATAAAILATWLWSRVEGGDLALTDYLDQVYGTPLIALEFMLGTLVAWWSAR